ncbi:hypothetical protein CPBF424_04030 [Xanthomonas euroxanthea]|uniref:Uncharacterized protein n=1 Tax=Xanthomonas euroxanthea TaxID=2259622 RepID=A0AA46C5M8_9XANT|nr:hypothetical protein CPBF424_04030 [Xanthomonas euroxanthea]
MVDCSPSKLARVRRVGTSLPRLVQPASFPGPGLRDDVAKERVSSEVHRHIRGGDVVAVMERLRHHRDCRAASGTAW